MGPLEKSLRGRAPNGRPLSDKQLKEVQDIDKMLGDMGKFGGGMDEDSGMGGGAGGGSRGGMGGMAGGPPRSNPPYKRNSYGQDRNSDVD